MGGGGGYGVYVSQSESFAHIIYCAFIVLIEIYLALCKLSSLFLRLHMMTTLKIVLKLFSQTMS